MIRFVDLAREQERPDEQERGDPGDSRRAQQREAQRWRLGDAGNAEREGGPVTQQGGHAYKPDPEWKSERRQEQDRAAMEQPREDSERQTEAWLEGWPELGGGSIAAHPSKRTDPSA